MPHGPIPPPATGSGQKALLGITTPSFPATNVFVQNTTGVDVLAYLGMSGVTATHVYINSTNSATGAVDLITQAATGMAVLIPKDHYFSMTFSAGSPSWTWVGLI
jgi:hypothetical protein